MITMRRMLCVFTLGMIFVLVSASTATAQFAIYLPLLRLPVDQIAYVRDVTSSGSTLVEAIYLMDDDGGNQTRLTEGDSSGNQYWRDRDPRWSPDGSRLLFACLSVGVPIKSHIYIINVDGTGQTNLTPNITYAETPRWSPDGMRILFIVGGDTKSEIYVMNSDGSNQTQLTVVNALYDAGASWSPDGSKIAFLRGGKPESRDIYVMNADGSNQINLTNTPIYVESDPVWSPDGLRILFDRRPFPYNAAADSEPEIYVMYADGSNLTNLTNTPGIRDESAAWSPNGRTIGFARTLNFWIYLMNADGSNQTQLTNTPGGAPVWSPDGTRIAWPNMSGEIRTIDADGSGETLNTTEAIGWWAVWRP